jgi:hypothetical protein
VLEKVVWPIAPRRESMGGGMYRGKKVSKKRGWVVWEVREKKKERPPKMASVLFNFVLRISRVDL